MLTNGDIAGPANVEGKEVDLGCHYLRLFELHRSVASWTQKRRYDKINNKSELKCD